LRLKDGTEIRLDRLISVDGKPFLVRIMEISALNQSQSFVKPATVAGMVESIIGCRSLSAFCKWFRDQSTRCNGTSDQWFDDKSIE